MGAGRAKIRGVIERSFHQLMRGVVATPMVSRGGPVGADGLSTGGTLTARDPSRSGQLLLRSRPGAPAGHSRLRILATIDATLTP
ncbi:hypothetical protein GCM10009626_25020 [Brachybacterium sacelli]